jgi:hypothetical protein
MMMMMKIVNIPERLSEARHLDSYPDFIAAANVCQV